ncbi:MAG: hypothetical protein KGQ47_04235 [Hyphomicrobiales bacterium]|nr:hypothetical protein [Hyphomicrobiales bacterium]
MQETPDHDRRHAGRKRATDRGGDVESKTRDQRAFAAEAVGDRARQQLAGAEADKKRRQCKQRLRLIGRQRPAQHWQRRQVNIDGERPDRRQ